METEVTSAAKEESNNFKNNAVESINKEITNETNIQPQYESSTEISATSSIETKGSNNKTSSGASPKLLEEENIKNTTTITNSPKNITNDDKNTLDDGSQMMATSEAGAVANVNAASDSQYFFEDEIFRIDKKGRIKFGLVLETPGNFSGDEEDAFEEILDKGEVRVVWYPEGKDTIQSENSIGLADRTLMPGDVVRRLVPGKETQRGYCRDINMKADVKVLGTKYIIKNVNAERLRVISNWQRDSAVCLDSWVGSTKDVEEKAVLRTASGCRIEISSNDFIHFQDNFFNAQIFYPGNTVIGSLPPMENIKILTPDIPLHTNKKGKPLTRKFTIEKVYTDSVWVHWQCKALSDETNLQNITMQPNPCVTGDDLKRLKRLNLFESCMLQVNDRSYLTFSSCDSVIKKTDWDKEQAVKFKLILQQQKEDNQKIFVRTSITGSTGGGGGGSGTHHHYEKFKKKLSLSLDDKASNKLKRNLFKNDKLNSKKETTQESNIAHEKYNNSSTTTTTATNKTTTTKDDCEWFSTEDEADIDEENYDECAMDIDNIVENLKQFTEDCVSTTTTMSTCSSPSPRTSPKHLTKRQLKKKARKNFKKPFLSKPYTEFNPKEGDELVTEAIFVYSTATVVWQDGTIESDIASTQLYPIHHLDNHEFFPGDFVICGKETDVSEVCYREYGVIQTVDHQGRTSHVKWFTTYTSVDEPKPTYKCESENSVYDLKDHPDFQYRPGTMVIRVANFVGEDANCTAGQIIDNYIDGRVKVWWVDGHISMCWPQDLFEVGQYDQGDWGHESEDSWETESENSELGCGSSFKMSIAESHILANIERARVAIARLEEILHLSPNLQNPEVMRKLLTVYKGCRYLDRLLSTNFFHEDHFMGLIERVRNRSMRDRVQDQRNRLFSDNVPVSSPSPNKQQYQYQYSAIVAVNSGGAAAVAAGGAGGGGGGSAQKSHHQSLSQQLQALPGATSKEYAPKVLFNISSTPFKCSNNHTHNSGGAPTPSSLKRRCSPVAAAREPQSKKTEDVPINTETGKLCIPSESINTSNEATSTVAASAVAVTSIDNLTTVVSNILPQFEISPSKNIQYNAEKNQLLNSVIQNIEKAFEKTSQLTASSQDDSGNYSRNENCDGSSTSYTSSSDLTNIETTNNSITKANDNQKSISCSSIELAEDAAPELVCVRLCSLLSEQLVKCINEIREKYYKDELVNIFEINVLENDLGESSTVDGEEKEKELVADDNVDGTTAKEISKEDNELKTIIDDADTLAPSTEEVNDPPEADLNTLKLSSECFQVLSSAPKNHKFMLTVFHPNNTQQYYKAVQRELRMLNNSLPPGVWVRAYEDRMDLLSVMIEGPERTPYEDGMFFFDIQLCREYPKSPPLCHYISYCSDRLNPNLYEDGKVCVSLLGTWTGKDTEVWGPNSTLLQVIVSIQGLILVPEPYFNEAGYEKQKATQQGKENSRMYNEMVIIKMVQATTKLMQNPPDIFREVILNHFKTNGMEMYERIKGWMEISKQSNAANSLVKNKNEKEKSSELNVQYSLPDFPLVPASRGFCLTLADLLENLKQKIHTLENMDTYRKTNTAPMETPNKTSTSE